LPGDFIGYNATLILCVKEHKKGTTMAHIAYLTLRGAKQGLISGGCNAKDSMGDRYQENHTDQITVLACRFSMHKERYWQGLEDDAVHITKPVDKSSPLLANAFARQEYLEGTIDFYRTNEKGYNEKFYSITLQKAVLSGLSPTDLPHPVMGYSEEMSETISLSYKGMQQTHLICGTMAFDGWESDNALSVVQGYQDLYSPTQVKAPVEEQTKESAQPFSLGWMQVDIIQSQQDLWADLFTSETTTEQRQWVKKYNTHLNEPVRPGEIVILPTAEPSTDQEKQSLNDMQEEVLAASSGLGKLSTKQVSTLNRHLELLDYYADQTLARIEQDGLPSDYYAYASLGVGMAAAGVEQHLKNINGVLREINDLYASQVAMVSRIRGINYGEFIAKRAELFKKLDGSFAGLSKRSIHLPVYTQIKRSLRLSTKSVVHHADEILKTGVVKNLGKRIANVASGISAARGVGYIGLGLGAASGVKNIYEACNVDSDGNCGKTSSREVGGFLGGVYLGGEAGALAVGGVMLVLGTASAPVIAVASIGAFVAAGAIGGIIGSTVGKAAGDIFYEKTIEIKVWGEEKIEELF